MKPASSSSIRQGQTQSAPLKKTEATAAESSTSDSREPLEERLGESHGAEPEKAPHSDGATDRKPSTEANPKGVTRNPSMQQSQEQPLPPLPAQAGRSEQMDIPVIGVQGPTPVASPTQASQPRLSTDEAQIIQDQTPEQQQRDNDLEMKDVPISSNDVVTDESTSDEPQRQGPPVVDLPPPPPREQREKEVESQRAAEVDVFTPKQSLLGPMRPEFKGKKCLVLDLDETLVHSSFKVRDFDIRFFHVLIKTGPAPGGLHYSGGD